MKETQYKILVCYVPTNKLLYELKRKTSPNYQVCLSLIETIEHLFLECSIVKTFWSRLCELWCKDTGNTKLDTNLKHIILGFEWENIAQLFCYSVIREVNIIIPKFTYLFGVV